MGHKQTTQEPYLHYKQDPRSGLTLILPQVDDLFFIGAPSMAHALEILKEIQSHVTNPLNELGTIKCCNGIDITQTRDCNKMSCEKYIDKIVEHHGWKNKNAASHFRANAQEFKFEIPS
jgi:hypothetical protein